MKKITFIFLIFIASLAVKAQVLSHSTDQTIANGLVACADSAAGFTTENHFWRSYTPADFGVTGTYSIGGAAFAMSFTDNGGTDPTMNIVVNFYTSSGAFPTGTLTLIGTKTVTMNASQDLTLLTAVLDTPVSVNATDEVAIEITPDDGTTPVVDIRIAGNDLGQDAPSYISSGNCGINTPTSYTDINFPNNDMIINLLDEASTAGVNDNLVGVIEVFPNPISNSFKINYPSNITIKSATLYDLLGKNTGIKLEDNSMNTSSLNAGIYMLKIETNLGTHIEKIIKK